MPANDERRGHVHLPHRDSVSGRFHNRFLVPHSHMASRTGMIDLPRSDKLYSTLGGTCGYSLRTISSSASSSLSVRLRVLSDPATTERPEARQRRCRASKCLRFLTGTRESPCAILEGTQRLFRFSREMLHSFSRIPASGVWSVPATSGLAPPIHRPRQRHHPRTIGLEGIA